MVRFIGAHFALAWLMTIGTLTSVATAQGFAEPTAEHKMLAELAGDWTVAIKSPDGSTSKGTSTYSVECNGMWVCSDLKADMWGAPFAGRGMDGYDTAKKKFVAVWVDSMGSAPTIFHGDYDAKTKKLTMVADAPGMDGQPAKWRSVTTFTDKDHHSFEMYVASTGGDEVQVMMAEYTRKK